MKKTHVKDEKACKDMLGNVVCCFHGFWFWFGLMKQNVIRPESRGKWISAFPGCSPVKQGLNR